MTVIKSRNMTRTRKNMNKKNVQKKSIYTGTMPATGRTKRMQTVVTSRGIIKTEAVHNKRDCLNTSFNVVEGNIS